MTPRAQQPDHRVAVPGWCKSAYGSPNKHQPLLLRASPRQYGNKIDTLAPNSRDSGWNIHWIGETMKFLRSLFPVVILATSLSPLASRAQTTPTHAADGVLAPSVLAQMLRLNTASGHDGEMPGSIAVALGLTTAEQPWPDRQVAVVSNDTGAVHAVAVGLGSVQDVILSVRGPVAISAFRVHRDGTLVSATNFFISTKATSALPPEQARSSFIDECAFWSSHIGRLVGPA